MKMRQTKNSSEMELQNKITKWEQELTTTGSVINEGEIFSVLRNIKEDENPIVFSQLLTLIAKSRATKEGNSTILMSSLEKAISLDPTNQYAKEFLLKDQWKRYQNKFDKVKFPVFRETDNRVAKKKTIDDYLKVCREFLASADETLDNINKQYEITSQSDDPSLPLKLEKIRRMFKDMFEEISHLLKTVVDFDESFSGIFYASIHFENVIIHLAAVNSIKTEWEEFFSAETEANQNTDINALEQLNEMTGIYTVKERINDFYSFLKYQNSRRALGFHTKDEISLNMILTGNPGTGKTTLARLLAKIYHELGVLPREEVIETNRSQLVGSFVGQTEEKVQNIVKKAIGGVLFIDEAYSLKREGQSGSDYGQTAIDTLVSLMTNQEYSGKFAVILAGYPEEMRQFLDSNTGLRSRFPHSNYIQLPDYTKNELIQIAESIAKDNDYILSDEAKIELASRIENEKVDTTFGNARTVKDIVLEAIFRKGANRFKVESFLTYILLDQEDFLAKVDLNNENPHEQLQTLIGLETVKKEVKSLVAFVKVQQKRRENGLPVVPIQLHAVFSGNPGTGKTTVAKIYANLLKEYGILKRGHLIITSRADFVAGYVGQTAIKTKKKIREALGGVLFIDEAYSLLSHSNGDFGKEMIDTLVDEMTKHNENLVVILSGYPIELEKLLDSNPGLRSRFKKFLHFPDYSIVNLVKMMETYVEKYHYQLTDDAIKYLHSTLVDADKSGNGRFAINLMDEAIQTQAVRLIEESDGDLLTPSIYIEKSDVENALKKSEEESNLC